MIDVLSVNGIDYRIIKLLGKGKGGYSYLAERNGTRYVLKQIHHEPCEYYTFGDKMQAELKDYARLKALGITVPELIDADIAAERILKEYIEGETVFSLVKNGLADERYIAQVRYMCNTLYAHGLNIDYFPTNFIPSGGRLYYIDYECNAYSDEWNFENWGIRYWSETPEFKKYLRENNI